MILLPFVAITINEESFTGLNFRGFCGFSEDHKSFSMNIFNFDILAGTVACAGEHKGRQSLYLKIHSYRTESSDCKVCS